MRVFPPALLVLVLTGACEGQVSYEDTSASVLLREPFPGYLALRQDQLVVASGRPSGSVISIPLTGDTPRWIANCNCTGVAATQQYIFWTNSYGPLERATYDGSEIVRMYESTKGADPVADESMVYWAELEVYYDPAKGSVVTGRILALPIEGGEPKELAKDQNRPTSLALNSTHLYWATYERDGGTVRRVPRNGGPVEDIALGLTTPNDVCLTSTHVYWAEDEFVDGRLMRVPLDGGQPEVMAHVDQPFGLGTDDSYLYWGSHQPITGTVMRMPLDGGTPTVVARHQDRPGVVVVDSTYVYWGNLNGGTVMRKAKADIQ